MSAESKHIDHLFEKARKADVRMSVDKVAEVVAKTTLIGSIMAVLFGKFKVMNIILLSTVSIATTVAVVTTTINNEPINESNNSNPIVASSENDENPSSIEEEENREPIPIIVNDDSEEIEFRSDDIELIQIDEEENLELDDDDLILNEDKPRKNKKKKSVKHPANQMDLEYFNSIVLAINADVKVVKGSSCSAEIHNEKFKDLVKIEVKNEAIIIEAVKGKEKEYSKLRKAEDLKITVTMKDIKGIVLSGSGEIVSEDDIPCEELVISVSGSGDIKLNKVTPSKNWKVSVAGSGDVELNGAGSSEEGKINIAGSGDVAIPNLSTKQVSIAISGSGDANVNASEKLNASIAGSGDVCYSGDAETSISATGSGEVSKCK